MTPCAHCSGTMVLDRGNPGEPDEWKCSKCARRHYERRRQEVGQDIEDALKRLRRQEDRVPEVPKKKEKVVRERTNLPALTESERASLRFRRVKLGLSRPKLSKLSGVSPDSIVIFERDGYASSDKRQAIFAALERVERGETQPDKRLIDETRSEATEGIAEPSAPIYETDPEKSLKVAEAILKNPGAKKVFSHVSVNAGPLAQTDSPSFDDLIRELSSNPRVREIRFATIVMEG